MVLFPECKINLGLQITEKREDGYHNINSVMYPLFLLCDTLEVLKMPHGVVNFSSSGIQIDCEANNNLCIKAYRLLQQEFNLEGGISIHLHKKIPFGAGLGGGSSNAAAVLKAVNELYGLGLSTEELCQRAAIIGSDAPFFIYNTPMLCTGRGEQMRPIDLSLKGWHLVLIKPDIYISTAEAYSIIIPHKPTYDISKVVLSPIEHWSLTLTNDFEAPLFTRYSVLDSIKAQLYGAGATYCSMSGSGSAIYALSTKPLNIPAAINPLVVLNTLI